MSSSPAPEAEKSGGQEEITFRFCRECSNMLYPKEDRINSKLLFSCRTCQFSEDAPSSCVYRNTLSNTVGETAGVTQDVGSDPTVGHASRALIDPPVCTLCGDVLVCMDCGQVRLVEPQKKRVRTGGGRRAEQRGARSEEYWIRLLDACFTGEGMDEDVDEDVDGDP